MTTPEERLRRMMAGARGQEPVSESEWDGFVGSARRSLRIQRMVAGAVAAVVLVGGGIGATALLDKGPGDEPIGPAGSQTPDGCFDLEAGKKSDACDYIPQPSRAPTPDTSPTTAPSGIELEPPPEWMGEIWLVDPKAETLSWGYREMPGAEDSLEAVISELLRSPIASDVEAGYESEIPEGTELLGAEVSGGVAEIDLSSEFDDPGSENPGTLRTREAQVVFTATQIEGVDSVRIFVSGEPYLDQVNPTERDDYGDIAPPIVVETPRIGQEVASPLTLTGSANVFEATVSYEINSKPAPITADGKYTIKGFTTATCGSGCRGDFSEKIPFVVDEPTVVTLSVFEVSAEDGSHLHEISLPITLLPSD